MIAPKSYRVDVEQITSFESLASHLAEAEGKYAKSSLEAYFFENAYTGSLFESFCSKDPNRFSAEDIVAVSMLSVNIPASATRWILGDGSEKLSELLHKINEQLSIDNPDADLTNGGHAWKLWKELSNRWGIGETKCSKLLASKRPALFPIYDQHVADALNLSSNHYWRPWQEFMRSQRGIESRKRINSIAQELDKSHLSELRLFDVIIWMQRHGHKYITAKLVSERKMIPVNYAKPV